MGWFFKGQNLGDALANLAYHALKSGVHAPGQTATWKVRKVEVGDVPIGDWKITIERL